MVRPQVKKSQTKTALGILELIFHAAIRDIRKSHRSAVIGLILNIFQTVLMVAIFYFMFDLLGMRGRAVRGDFMLYIMTGVFMFFTHTKAMGAVVGSEGPTSPMMKHAPMNTIISISSSALSSLYIQFLSASVVLFGYHAIFTPIHIEDPVGVLGMFLLSWASGVAIGMVFLAAKPWQPEVVGIISQIYQRANMIASGKMFLANTMPGYMLAMFDWNPLFHTIDQTRGFTFINYNPHYSVIDYPIKVTIACMMIGLMGEFYTRRKASISWGAKR